MGMGGQHHPPPAALPPGRTLCTLIRRLGRHRSRSGRLRKISPPPGFDLWNFQVLASRYTNCTIPTHKHVRSHYITKLHLKNKVYLFVFLIMLYMSHVVTARKKNYFKIDISFSIVRKPPLSQDFFIMEASQSHSGRVNCVLLLWTSDRPVSETSNIQNTTLTRGRHYAPGGIQTRNSSKRATVDPCLRPQGHRHRPKWA